MPPIFLCLEIQRRITLDPFQMNCGLISLNYYEALEGPNAYAPNRKNQEIYYPVTLG